MVASRRVVILCAVVFMVSLGGSFAQGDVLVPYQATGWRYMQVPTNDPLAGEFWRLDFDDSAWPTGQGAFGNDLPACSLSNTVHTQWQVETEMLLRRKFIADPLQPMTVYFAIDNDALIYVNEVLIASVTHEYCPRRDEFAVVVPGHVIVAGENTLAVRAIDRGAVSFVDVRVIVPPAFPQECPEPVGQLPGVFGISAVAVKGEYAYLGRDAELLIADLSDPLAMRVVGSVELQGSNSAIAVSGDHAYVATKGEDPFAGTLSVIDVREPSEPVEVGFLGVSGYALAVSGDYVYMAAGGEGLFVIDVSDPHMPIVINHTDSSGDILVTSGGYLFTVGCELNVFDLNVPSSPVEVWSEPLCPWNGGPLGAAVSHGFLYVTSISTDLWGQSEIYLSVFDARSPSAPERLTDITVAGYGPISTSNVSACRNHAFVWVDQVLHVIDVSTPWSPIEVRSLVTLGPPLDLSVSGSHIYAAAGDSGLYVLDTVGCRPPTQPSGFPLAYE